ncbi:MAG: tRNA lysidine(34) synthetase TilS [Acidimicrobiales bacterium]|nr:tRNA lysidine(34) synthetase TilS [Acidimicrobiales bacterium]
MSQRSGSTGCGPLSPEPGRDAAEVIVRFGALLDRCMFPPAGTAVTCAVSGGADSTAMLALAAASGLTVTAVHVDHGLRPGSSDEAEVVAASARRVGAAFRSVSVTVAPGPNLEERARIARHSVLPPDTLFGHTADDQAETVLLNLLRGTGLHGLAGMRPGPRHPILGLRRSETRAICDALGLDVVDDPSNRDLRLRRNRVRYELLPLLEDIAQRDVVPLLNRTALIVRDATDHLDAAAAALDPTDARSLADAPPVLARLAVRAWLARCDELGHPPDYATIDRVLSVARGEAAATEVAGGWRVARRAGRLRLEPPR